MAAPSPTRSEPPESRTASPPLLGRRALFQFNIAFALMTVIPLLICCYLIAVRFFSLEILVGLNGVYFLLAVVLALLGLLLGRRQIQELVGQLAGANTAMQELVDTERQRVLDLVRAYQDLRTTQVKLVQAEKMGAVGQLASGVAHEIKNPLTIILQSVSALEQAATDPALGREALGNIKDAVGRADGIVRSLLTFARQATLRLTPGELPAVVETSLRLAEQQLRRASIRVTREFEPALPPVPMDENQLQQVFINLFLNALQAMPAGGTLTIRAYAQTLARLGEGVGRRATDQFRPGDHAVVCEVRDTGGGVAPEDLGKVFDPFFTTRPAGEGTGLGLSISRSIIESHRGLIHIESEMGRGTTVRVTLPVARGAGGGEV